MHYGDLLSQSDGILTLLRFVVHADSIELVSGSPEHPQGICESLFGHLKIHNDPPLPPPFIDPALRSLTGVYIFIWIEPAGSDGSALNRQWRLRIRHKTSGTGVAPERLGSPVATPAEDLRLQQPHRRSLRDPGHESAGPGCDCGRLGVTIAGRSADGLGVGGRKSLNPYKVRGIAGETSWRA